MGTTVIHKAAQTPDIFQDMLQKKNPYKYIYKASETYMVEVSLRVIGSPVYFPKNHEGRASPEKYDHNIV